MTTDARFAYILLAISVAALAWGLVDALRSARRREKEFTAATEARLRKLADDFGPATCTDIDAALALAAHTNVGIERLASVAPVIPLRGGR